MAADGAIASPVLTNGSVAAGGPIASPVLTNGSAKLATQDAAIASLLRAYGIEDEKSTTVQAKLRLALPSFISFIASCIASEFEHAMLFWVLKRLSAPFQLVALVNDWVEGKFCEVDFATLREALNRKGDDTDGKPSNLNPEAPKGAEFSSPSFGKQVSREASNEKDTVVPVVPKAPAGGDRGSRPCRSGALRKPTSQNTPSDEGGSDAAPSITNERKRELIKDAQCFAGLDDVTLEKLMTSFELRKHAANSIIMRAGEHGDDSAGIHIMVKGMGKVFAPKSGLLNAGHTFGAEALLKGATNMEHLEACRSEALTLWLSAKSCQEMNLQRKCMTAATKKKQAGARVKKLDHRKSGFQTVDEIEEFEAVTNPEKEEDVQHIMEAIRENTNIAEVLEPTEEQCRKMAEVSYRVKFAKDEVVCKNGDQADAFYIVEKGTFKMEFEDEGSTILKTGDSFGEMALLYDTAHKVTVSCTRPGSLWSVSFANFKKVLAAQASHLNQQFRQLIDGVPLFKDMADVEKDNVCCSLDEMFFRKGDTIVKQGEIGNTFYLIFEGTCEVMIDGKLIRELSRGDFFGEKALLQDEPRTATVAVVSETCTTMVFDRVTFALLKAALETYEYSSPVDRRLSTKALEKAVRHSVFAKDRSMSTFALDTKNIAPPSNKRRSSMDNDSDGEDNNDDAGVDCARVPWHRLERIGLLGKGSFGFVTLERDLVNKRLYALKALSKGQIIHDRVKDQVLNELKCMQLVQSQFIVQLFCTYRDATSVYFLLEPCFGGELYEIYSDSKIQWGAELHARYYTACVTCAFSALHGNKIIYRDLKLENCLLTSTGSLKLTDLGLAKVVLGKTYTCCGTNDYFAPETLRQQGHNRAVDWWALGVLIFVMMSGRTPFDADDVMQIYKNIIQGMGKASFPAEMPPDCVNVIKALCAKKPAERITMKAGGIENLQKHSWFSEIGFDWDALDQGAMQPPWSPELDEEAIAAKIAAKPKESPPEFTYEDDGTYWDDCFDGSSAR